MTQPKHSFRSPVSLALAALLASACGAPTAATGEDAGAPADGDSFGGAVELRVPVPETGRVYVSLAAPALVEPGADPSTSAAWDLAFEGYDVFTNSGPSGQGKGGGFGPLSTTAFLGSAAPDVPFLEADKAGGAFLDWYQYEGKSHVLYSRFHVYGVRSGARNWKVQILTYYGERSGAPTSALYQIRYADLAGGAAVETSVDGTAGGLQSTTDAPSGCLTLASGAVSMLTPTEVKASPSWDLCFRRDAISVNSEAGGPGTTSAADLQEAETASETLTDIEARTADSESASFDGVGAPALAAASLRGDHVVSAFERGHWIDPASSPRQPASAAWLVVDASGQRKFLVSFSAFEKPTTSSAGTIVMRVKPVSQ